MRLASQAGQGAFFAGLFLLAGKQDGAMGISGLFAGMMAAAIMFGLIGGAVGDRLGASRAVIVGAAGRGTAVGLGLILATVPGLGDHFGLAALVAFLYSAASQLFCPAELALAATISPRQPGRAHAALVALQYGGQGLGLVVVAPLAYAVAGIPAMLASGLALFALVTFLATLLTARLHRQVRVTRARHAFRFRSAVRYYRREPHAVYAGALLAFGELSMKAMAVALPVYFARDLRLEATQTGLLVVPGAIAAILGLLWAFRSLHVHVAPQVMRLTLLGTAVGVLALSGLGQALAGIAEMGHTPVGVLDDGSTMSLVVAIPVSILLGICLGVAPVGGRTILSATAPREQQSRVFAMQSTVTDILAIAPTLLAGVGVELAGARVTFAVIGVLGLAAFFLLETPRLQGPAPVLATAREAAG
jgi:MFS family permease